MAEENIIQTNIVANSDMSGLISDLNRVSSALSKLQEKYNASNKALTMQIAAMNRSFAETMRSTGQFSTHFVSLTSDVDKFGQQLDRGKLKLSEFFRVYGQHTKTTGGLIRDLARQQVQLQNAVLQPLGRNAEGLMQYNVHIPRGLDTVKNKTALARQELQIMNKVVQEGANQLINWGKNTQWAGRQLTVGLTVPMAAFGKAAADAFKTADQELVRLTKVYGGLAATSSTELMKVRKDVSATAAELAKGYGASFTETLGLAADIAATGKQGNELLGSIKETTRLAVLGEVDRQEAMKATLAIQTAFKQNTEELSASINFLNAVENQTSTTLADLVEAIPKAGPIIKGLGGSVQDLALYLTAMREGGVSAAEGANALKSALGALINPTKVATNMFAGFGIDLKGIVQENAGNVTKTILALQAALDQLNPLQKQQALEQLFGKFQFARMNALFSNLGKQGSQTLEVLDLMKASSQDLANIASRELTQVTESASGKYRRALEGLKADLAGVGEQFLTINTTLINIVDGIIKFASNLPKPIKQLLSIMGMFTAVAGPLIMLTGVLGNFFGYIIKGVYHFKALFKGAEGWKLLTPEILAANKAGDLAEQTFYSDARAAAILKQSLDGLIGSYTALESRIKSGVINVSPMTALAGREVNPQHPLLSPMDTRSMSHLNPVSKMTVEQKAAQTIFSAVPGAPLVNQKIGGAPQIYMESDLPKIQGVTSMSGVSTGVVAEEAAKWHAMTAALAMQSKADIKRLKTEVGNTGLVTAELSTAYDALLPRMNELTKKAAVASAEIVAQVRAGKLTADQARAQIVALNAEIEGLMGQAAVSTATSLGRTIDITKVPLTNQPVVNPKTSKLNMKELVKPGRTRELLNTIARALGVKTFGAPYSIETTRPKKFNTGGDVFFNDGNQVPGPNVNADVVPAMLTPGEFVIRRDVAQQDPDGMRALNEGRAVVVPVQNRFAGGPILNMLTRLAGWSRSRVGSARRIYESGANPSTRKLIEDGNFGPDPYSSMERRSSTFWTPLLKPGQRKPGEVLAHVITSKYLRRFKNFRMQGSAPVATGSELERKLGIAPSGNSANKEYQILPDNVINVQESFNKALAGKYATGQMWLDSKRQPQHLISLMSHLLNAGVPYKVAYRVASRTLSRIDNAMMNLRDTRLSETKWGNIVDDAMAREVESIQNSYRIQSQYAFNRGGQVPGYALGGGIKIPSWVIRNDKLNLTNTDPLHGPLQIGRYRAPLTIRNRRQGASIAYSGNYRPYTWDKGPRAGETIWTPGRSSNVQAFLTGSQEERGRYVTEEYMRGNYSVLQIPGATEAMRAWAKKASGTFHRGITLKGWSKVGGQMPPLPKWLLKEIEYAQKSGDFSKLIGKEFIMRRSSWSANPETAKGFGDFQLEANVANRRVTPASQMFPSLEFMSPSGTVNVNEQESIFGGKFRIVGANKGGLKLETVNGPMGGRRAMGGPVNAGMPYVVGENGPELFVPRNAGGIIPRYRLGGGVLDRLRMHGWLPGTASSRLNYQVDPMTGEPMLLPGPAKRSFMPRGGGIFSSILGSSAGAAVGGAVGGQGGAMIGSIAGSFLPNLIVKLATVVRSAGGFLKIVMNIGKVLKSLTIPGAILTVLAIGAKKLLDWKKAAEDAGKANRLAFGGTASSYASVGIKNYQTLTDRLKAYNDQLELNKAKIRSTFESYTKTGATGITYSIEELNKAITNAKQNQKEYVDAFNTIDASQVNRYAIQLKAQFVALGLSASDAANQIYAIMKASDKASQALDAVSSTGFRSITDQVSALKSLLTNLSSNLGQTFNAEEFSRGLDALVNGAMNYASSLVDTKTKTGEVLDKNDALAITIEKIGKIQGKNNKLSSDQLLELKKQNIAYANILGTAETLQSTVAKILMYQSGMSEIVDLASMGAKEAIAFAENMKVVSDTIDKVFTNTKDKGNPLAPLAAALSKAKTASTSLQNQVKALQKFDKTVYEQKIKQQQDLIKAIDKERNARLKLLDLQEKAANFETDIKSAQIKYQEALASGDMAQAAQAQLDIQRLTQDRQREIARQAINDTADTKIEAAQKEIDRLQGIIDAKQKQIDNLTKPGGVTDTAGAQAKTLQEYMDFFSNLLLKYPAGSGKKITQTDSEAIQNTIQAMLKSTDKSIQQLARDMQKKFTITSGSLEYGGKYTTSTTFNAEGLLGGLQDYLDKQGKAANEKFPTAVEKFAAAVKEFAGIPGGVPGGQPFSMPKQGEYYSNKFSPDTSWMLFQSPKGKKIAIFGDSKTFKDIYADASDKGWRFVGYKNPGLMGESKAPTSYTKVDRTDIVRAARGGLIRHYGPGGYVDGPGTATSDSIPAMLSNGEYVVNAASAAKFGYGNLDNINRMAAGGMVKYDIPNMSLKLAGGGGPVYNSGSTTTIGEVKLEFNQLPENPRQFGAELIDGIKMGRGRLYTAS